jgi:hypothetical protein
MTQIFEKGIFGLGILQADLMWKSGVTVSILGGYIAWQWWHGFRYLFLN